MRQSEWVGLLLIGGAGLVTWLLTRQAPAEAAIPVPEEGAWWGMPELTGTDLSEAEREAILRIAAEEQVDPRFLASLRRTEMGGPGREYGVLSIPAPTYEDQARIAARTIYNTLDRYRRNVGLDPVGLYGRYTLDFIRYFSQGGPGYPGYAPIGALNDPTGLNRNHLPNLLAWYGRVDTVTV